MPTATKTFAFATTAEGFAATQQATNTTLSYDAAVGNPAGSLKARRTGRNQAAAQSYWEWSGTWEDLGVPPGTEVTALQLTGCSTRCSEYTTGASSTIGPYELRSSAGVLVGTLWTGRTVTASSTSWTATGAQTAVTFAAQPSSTIVKIRLADTLATGNSTSAAVTTYDDQVALAVSYQVPVRMGNGGGSWWFSGAAVGSMSPKATGAGTWTFVGGAVGGAPTLPPNEGSGSGSVTFTGAAQGSRAPKGAASGSYAYTGTATGARTPKGVGSGTLVVTGAAAATTARRGAATGSTTWTGSAVGAKVPKATATGSTAWVGVAAAGSVRVGAGAGARTFTGAATGTAPFVVPAEGSASGLTTWQGVAGGACSNSGIATGMHAFMGAASGLRTTSVAPPARTATIAQEARMATIATESRAHVVTSEARREVAQ